MVVKIETFQSDSLANSGAAETVRAADKEREKKLQEDARPQTDPGVKSAGSPAPMQKTEGESHLPPLAVQEVSHDGFFYSLAHKTMHTLVQSPIEGAAQTFDHTVGKSFGSHLYEKSKNLIINEPKAAVFGSAEWHGQTIGGAVGMMPWFFATRSALRAGLSNPATRGLLVNEAEAALNKEVLSSVGRKQVLESGLTGAAYSAALKPVEVNDQNYWTNKSKDVVRDFVSFSTLTASSIRIGALLPAGELPLVAGQSGRLKSVISGVASGVPTALVDMNVERGLSGGESDLSTEEFVKRAYSYAVVGGTLGAVHNPGTKELKQASALPAEEVSGKQASPSLSGKEGEGEPIISPQDSNKREVSVSDHIFEKNLFIDEFLSGGDTFKVSEIPGLSPELAGYVKHIHYGKFGGAAKLFADIMNAESTEVSDLVNRSARSRLTDSAVGVEQRRFEWKVDRLPESTFSSVDKFLQELERKHGPIFHSKMGSKPSLLEFAPDPYFFHSLGKHLSLDSLLSDGTHVDKDSKVIRTDELAASLKRLPTASEFQKILNGRPVGELPEELRASGLTEAATFKQLDSLAQALRALDSSLPPQKKTGAGARDLGLSEFQIGLGLKNISVSKIGIGEVANVYKLTVDGKDFAFKVPNDPARMDVHGAYSETAAFAFLSKEKSSDLIDFHAANPAPHAGWMLTEYVSEPVIREGRSVASILADHNLQLGDDWSANRGPGNVVWDLGGIEPKDLKSPQNLDELTELLKTPMGKLIAGRKLGAIKDQAELKEALLFCLEEPSLGGQVARTAVMRLHNSGDINDVLSNAVAKAGAAGRVAFELDRLPAPYITELFYKALNNPESRIEAAKMIDKLPLSERKKAFDTAFTYPEARAAAARAINHLGNETERLEAMEAARAYPSSNFVLLQKLSQTRPLTAAEAAERSKSFEDFLAGYGLDTGRKLTEPKLEFSDWLAGRSQSDQALLEPTKSWLTGYWSQLTDAHKSMPAEDLNKLVMNYPLLKPEQWRQLTADEVREHIKLVEKAGFGPELSNLAFQHPDFKKWALKQSAEDLPLALILRNAWNSVPLSYKELPGEDLAAVQKVWVYPMHPGDWYKIPAADAARVADTIIKLKIDDSRSGLLVDSPGFLQWFGEHEALLNNFSRSDFRAVLDVWNRLEPADKSLAPEVLINRAGFFKYRDWLTSEVGADSPLLKYLPSAETVGQSPTLAAYKMLEEVDRNLSSEAKKGTIRILEGMARETVPAGEWTVESMRRKFVEEVLFEDQPELSSKLKSMNLPENVGNWLFKFVSEEPKRNTTLLKWALQDGLKADARHLSSLRELAWLSARLGIDEGQGLEHLYKLNGQGLRCRALQSFLDKKPESIQRVKELIANGASVKQLSVRYLADEGNINYLTTFSQTEIEKVRGLHEQGLSLRRLVTYLGIHLERDKAVKQLLQDGTSVKEVSDLMRLAVLPENASLRVIRDAREGKVKVENVIGKLRDYTAGRRFGELLVEHINGGSSVTTAAVSRLFWLAETQPATGSLEKSALDSAYVSSSTSMAAAAFVEAAESLIKKVPADTPIVLLGRDAWPLLPILRAKGREAQYFLWSRLQNSDEATKKQWLREIPPGAAVVDTGYVGSIIKNIQSIDPTATGYLMSTGGNHFPRLLGGNHSSKVDNIESLPKLIYRTHAHNEKGNAISRRKDTSSDVDFVWGSESGSRWNVERQSQELLRASGLSAWDAWRYSTFVGLTPQERLGLRSQADVIEHYRRVQKQRAELTPAAAN